jgi:hypothetical protein
VEKLRLASTAFCRPPGTQCEEKLCCTPHAGSSDRHFYALCGCVSLWTGDILVYLAGIAQCARFVEGPRRPQAWDAFKHASLLACFFPLFITCIFLHQEIAASLDAEGYDDGSMAPVLIRLAWHSAGSYDKATNTGGSNGATMRFEPECSYGANAGTRGALLHSVCHAG